MCSIFGAIGMNINEDKFGRLAHNAQDRGRDGGRFESYETPFGFVARLGNWRATPTPEPEIGELQPYNKLVHNGTIANDLELGALPGEIDSQALARYVDRANVQTLADSLGKVRGSYALACFNGRTILAAANYKPLYYHYDITEHVVYFSSMARHFEGVTRFGVAPVRLEPYTAIDFLTHDVAPIVRMDAPRAVVIASAGLDSTVAATRLVREGWEVCLLHFTYGCNAGTKEMQRIEDIALVLNCRFHYLDLDIKGMLGTASSTLFQNESKTVEAIQGAEYAHEWVPARNLMFISLAVAWAEANGYHAVALGNNLEEAGAYPDNEEEFTHLLDRAAPYAVQAGYAMRILSPVGNLMKHEIVKLGLVLRAPLDLTWSCYRGGPKHCGQCGPCFMRRKAFERSGAVDPVFGGD